VERRRPSRGVHRPRRASLVGIRTRPRGIDTARVARHGCRLGRIVRLLSGSVYPGQPDSAGAAPVRRSVRVTVGASARTDTLTSAGNRSAATISPCSQDGGREPTIRVNSLRRYRRRRAWSPRSDSQTKYLTSLHAEMEPLGGVVRSSK
jgi:hypothetical protein